MPSKKPSNLSREPSEKDAFLTANQQAFAELTTLLDLVEGFDFCFAECNFPREREMLIEGLRESPRCQTMQLEVLECDNAELRFLLERILEELPKIKVEKNKKLILILKGLEKSIGMTGEYPPMLVDLNWVRDAYPQKVPHPVVFILPDYAINRVARYAPDWYDWSAGVFRFETLQETKLEAMAQTLEAKRDIAWCEVPEKQSRIDLLERLLMEYAPSHGTVTKGKLRTRLQILNELGVVYRSQGEYDRAKFYLQQSLELTEEDEEFASVRSQTLNELGLIYAQQGEVEKAIAHYQQSLEISERIEDVLAKARTLNNLAAIYVRRGETRSAIAHYQQSLKISERIGNGQEKAATLHELGRIYGRQGNIEQALAHYQQSLEIDRQIENVQGEAETLHELGRIHARQGDIEQAIALYQQSLDIKKSIGDVQGKAATLNELGRIYADRGEVEEAISLYRESLDIFGRIKDMQGKAATLHELGRIYGRQGEIKEAIAFYRQALEIE
ncbi:MAG: tetratricopeptide repeat protein, partial [Cyanobacteriota bacterium]|nr:tetratricopeptide repeat protein [Cyanobacteriota bacterium]